MDTLKVGAFLRELRKEKNLTQEQLAEVFQVTNRTVSRWETGSNMPDISLLLEIADYYQLEVSEILNGERKPAAEEIREENTPAEVQVNVPENSELQEVAEYADADKEKLAVKTRIYAIAGLLATIISVCLSNFGPADNSGVNIIKKLCTLVVYLALSASIIYTTDRLQVLQRKYKEKLKKNLLPIILIVIGGIALLLAIMPMFMVAQAN